MKRFKVTPKRYGVSAPYYILESESDKTAVKEIKDLSGLGRFNTLAYNVKEMKPINKKFTRRNASQD